MLWTATGTGNSDRNGTLSLVSAPFGSGAASATEFDLAIDFVSDLAQRYELSSVSPLLFSCRSAVLQHEVSVAVIGRFKAGKSSFLNHFTGRSILPVGVIPVTAVVTEIRFGAVEKATVHFLDGRVGHLSLECISQYVSERDNPENRKGVKLIAVELPALARFRALKFIDTPGLESALVHNTEEALKWLPNAGLALVTVSADPPLSHHDIELLSRLYRFTPNVTVLLTKVDLLDAQQRAEVIAFVNEQLKKAFATAPQVFPYSIRPGYEDLKSSLETSVFDPVLSRFGEEREAIIRRKIDTLLRECGDYVTLGLNSAELADAERNALKVQVIGQQETVADLKSQIRLIVRQAAGGTRTFAESRFQAHQKCMERRLLTEFASEYPKWTKSLSFLLDSFDTWLTSWLAKNLAETSSSERSRLMQPLGRTSKQVLRILQDFRDRLSDETMRAFGTPLRTTELELEVREPDAPDVRVGKIFDRNWELLSPMVPVALIKSIVRHHFERQLPYKLFTNISRLVSQWEERINAALLEMEKEAERRLDELVGTVGRLIDTDGTDRLPEIRRDLQRIQALRAAITDAAGRGRA